MNIMHKIKFWWAVKRGRVMNKNATFTMKMAPTAFRAPMPKEMKLSLPKKRQVFELDEMPAPLEYIGMYKGVLEQRVETEKNPETRKRIDEEYKLVEELERVLTRHGTKQKSP